MFFLEIPLKKNHIYKITIKYLSVQYQFRFETSILYVNFWFFA